MERIPLLVESQLRTWTFFRDAEGDFLSRCPRPSLRQGQMDGAIGKKKNSPGADHWDSGNV